jgi:geranylgeranyl diphosphate synthase type I
VSQHALNELGLDQRKATNYGRDIAILTGDVQHGWSIAMLTDPKLVNHIDAAVVFELIKQMQTTVLTTLVHGEVLDVEFGLKNQDILDIPEEKIIQMLWMKTGILYEYSGLAGAMIGKNSADMNDPEVVALKTFCSNCGTAFQLRDDILGITGDEKNLGKPIGSDIREGKKTTIIRAALTHASKKEKKAILDVLGKKDSTLDEISRVTNLLKNLGGIDHTYDLSVEYIKKALPSLDVLKESRYKTYLKQWANYMIERNF